MRFVFYYYIFSAAFRNDGCHSGCNGQNFISQDRHLSKGLTMWKSDGYFNWVFWLTRPRCSWRAIFLSLRGMIRFKYWCGTFFALLMCRKANHISVYAKKKIALWRVVDLHFNESFILRMMTDCNLKRNLERSSIFFALLMYAVVSNRFESSSLSYRICGSNCERQANAV